MKCIISKSGKTIDRVKDEVASKKVNTGNWAYCAKELWKQRVRNKSTMEVEEVSPETETEKVHGLKAKDRKKLNKKG